MPKRICIVDDQHTIREMLRFALVLQGFEVVAAVDGADALEKIVGLDIDMIIADLQMPVMHGLELLERLRKLDAFADLPVVMISCRDDIEARRRARELGVLSWLKKPFRIADLQLIVKNCFCNTDIRHNPLIDQAVNGCP